MTHSWSSILIFSLLLVCIGFMIGFVSRDFRYRRAATVLGHFIKRVIHKAIIRTVDTRIRNRLAEQDSSFARLSSQEKAHLVDARALKAVTQFKAMLSNCFDQEQFQLYVFGSRVRGDYTDWSDVDVLLIVESVLSRTEVRAASRRAVFHILWQQGMLIQPRLFASSELNLPDHAFGPLIKRALQTGILI
jgi:hypothetical protein